MHEMHLLYSFRVKELTLVCTCVSGSMHVCMSWMKQGWKGGEGRAKVLAANLWSFQVKLETAPCVLEGKEKGKKETGQGFPWQSVG